MNTVLITGGAGFIGTHLVDALQGQAVKIVLVDNFLPQVHKGRDTFSKDLQAKAICIVGDIREAAVWKQIAASHPDIDTVVHLAALTGTGQSMYALRDYDAVNCGGTAALLEALLDRREPAHTFANLQNVILASSRAVYGEGAYHDPGNASTGILYPAPRSAEQLARQAWGFHSADGARELEPTPTPEDAPAQPNSFYGVTKLVQEQYIRTMLAAAGIPHTLLRFQNVFGPGQSLKNPYTGVIGVFYSNIVGGRGLDIYEDGNVTRDFVYVTDVVAAIVAAIQHPVSGTYNIGSGRFTRLREVGQWLCEALGREVPITCKGMYRVGDIRHNAADIRRAQAVLHYAPLVSVQEGLHRYVAWAQTETPMDAATIAAADEELRVARLSA